MFKYQFHSWQWYPSENTPFSGPFHWYTPFIRLSGPFHWFWDPFSSRGSVLAGRLPIALLLNCNYDAPRTFHNGATQDFRLCPGRSNGMNTDGATRDKMKRNPTELNFVDKMDFVDGIWFCQRNWILSTEFKLCRRNSNCVDGIHSVHSKVSFVNTKLLFCYIIPFCTNKMHILSVFCMYSVQNDILTNGAPYRPWSRPVSGHTKHREQPRTTVINREQPRTNREQTKHLEQTPRTYREQTKYREQIPSTYREHAKHREQYT